MHPPSRGNAFGSISGNYAGVVSAAHPDYIKIISSKVQSALVCSVSLFGTRVVDSHLTLAGRAAILRREAESPSVVSADGFVL